MYVLVASAGGIEAIRTLVTNLPKNSEFIYIIASHSSPFKKSFMLEILGRETSIPVETILDQTLPEPNKIYLIPPGYNLEIKNKKFNLSKPKSSGSVPSIDKLMNSMANELKDKSVGIILSGSSSDGAIGLKSIKDSRGTVIAQSIETAKYESMPLSAIKEASVEFVFSPKEIAEKLTDCILNPKIISEKKVNSIDLKNFQELVKFISDKSKIDFTKYKENTLFRQLKRRMDSINIDLLQEYFKILNQNELEIKALANYFFVSVTSFFRDKIAFESLKSYLYKLLDQKKITDQLRVWVPACATGEEVYSIAILVLEYFEKNNIKFKTQIFATDISSTVIDKARIGFYQESEVSMFTEGMIQKYFTPEKKGYFVSNRVKDLIFVYKT